MRKGIQNKIKFLRKKNKIEIKQEGIQNGTENAVAGNKWTMKYSLFKNR